MAKVCIMVIVFINFCQSEQEYQVNSCFIFVSESAVVLTQWHLTK